MSWQKGTHRLKFGGDLNPTHSNGLWGFCTPMCVGAFSPTYLESTFGAGLRFVAAVPVPTTPNVLHQRCGILNLPVLNIGSSIFSGIGVGTTSLPGAYDYGQNKNLQSIPRICPGYLEGPREFHA